MPNLFVAFLAGASLFKAGSVLLLEVGLYVETLLTKN